MNRYHKKIYYPHTKQLETFTRELNSLEWNVSAHALERVRSHLQLWDLNILLNKIKHYTLEVNTFFEYYTLNDTIIKVCYRIPYNDDTDLILVVGQGKKLITVYLNAKNDTHVTLKSELYVKS